MLRIGLTGGIGAGKSTVSATFNELGGIVVDGDAIAREVVEPGTEGLAALVEAFGEQILRDDGSLDRPALAAIAFSDDQQRATLNGIVHPLVGKRREELIAAAPDDAVIVEDIPLLVESHMAPFFPLVVVVHADVETRVQRLVAARGMAEPDARARIAAQADDEQRRAVADVWLDNSASQDDLTARARRLWHERIVPFAENVRAQRPAAAPSTLVPTNPEWAAQAKRIIARLTTASGHRALRVDHVGSTSVPGLEARDVIDIQVTVAALADADALAEALLTAGYPRVAGVDADVPKPDGRSTVAEFDHTDDAALWRTRFHASADPGRPTHVHLRVAGWPNQQFSLLFADWLREHPRMADDYLAAKRNAFAAPDYGTAMQPWFAGAYRRAWDWADASGWRP
ncbi:dephospho-CoA kinase [Mycobacterium sp. MYCO198283]|uniref:dephospho-CoA kinase n=1 Tax=Mycobacterium sp. MYCO198283 TaxID=2883505 RepID=UPI001E425423|nr:dephospho-CoA kinase [Mycobacterium sp. MYCO198283]MCG5433464.1 dephospho-CoA kinase [Mycobacterium sp. MYCO198283]